MKILQTLLRQANNLLIEIKKYFRKKDRNCRYKIEYVQDFPDVLDKNKIYLIGKPGQEWLAGLSCPCGCNELIELVLIGNHPKWEIHTSKTNKISIKPSVWKKEGCKSHFFIKGSTIVWC